MALSRLDCWRDILRSLDFDFSDIEAKRAGGRLDLSHFPHCGWIADIHQERTCAVQLGMSAMGQ
jgi:hypothetical protein